MEEGAGKSFLEEVLADCRSFPCCRERRNPNSPSSGAGSQQPHTSFGFPGIPRVFRPPSLPIKLLPGPG